MDFTKIFQLLHVEEKARNHPKLKNIHDAAMAELQTINDEQDKEKADHSHPPPLTPKPAPGLFSRPAKAEPGDE